ncbi:MAG: tetratricopeptide repeat protein [Acidobacteria bacterium]|nr:tetratricopeptide repeat protein [Acidobacteriota bacterium]
MKHPSVRRLQNLAAGTILFCAVTIGGAISLHGSPGPLPPSPGRQEDDRRNDTNYILQKVMEWREAAEQHAAGKPDTAAATIGQWNPADCEIVIDFVTDLAGKSKKSISRTLSKAPIRRRLGVTTQEIQQGDLNRILKEGALLHTDIALLDLETDAYPDRNDGVGIFVDGRVIPIPRKFHWPFARRLIDAIAPSPSQDETARQWYIATTAYMLSRGHLADAKPNLESAKEIYPSDDRILFYTGVLHETQAAPSHQNAQLPPGSSGSYGSKKSELKKARKLFLKAIEVNPDFAEARLRLGRVYGLLGDHRKAIAELQKASEFIKDPQLKYYIALYQGREFAMISRFREARNHYERAAMLYPNAQSPLFGLSQLARIRNDSEGALLGIERIFELPVGKSPNDNDPWWKYNLSPVRNAEILVAEMHEMLAKMPDDRQ